MQLSKDTTLSYDPGGDSFYPLKMDPRDALDATIKHFGLTAKTLAEAAGIGDERLSKYRNKVQDMHSTTVFKLVAALPRTARFYFYSLIEPELEEPEASNSKVSEPRGIYKIDPLAIPPAPYTSYLWQWLAVNQVAPTELKKRLETEGLSLEAIAEIFNGKAPTPEELQVLNQVLADLHRNDGNI